MIPFYLIELWNIHWVCQVILWVKTYDTLCSNMIFMCGWYGPRSVHYGNIQKHILNVASITNKCSGIDISDICNARDTINIFTHTNNKDNASLWRYKAEKHKNTQKNISNMVIYLGSTRHSDLNAFLQSTHIDSTTELFRDHSGDRQK